MSEWEASSVYVGEPKKTMVLWRRGIDEKESWEVQSLLTARVDPGIRFNALAGLSFLLYRMNKHGESRWRGQNC